MLRTERTARCKMEVYLAMTVIVIGLLFSQGARATAYNVLNYGAIGDGIHKDTKAVQEAIDVASGNGGGRVLIPSGSTVLIGTIFLKDHVTLYIENGAVLRGSPDIADYATATHKNMYKNEPHMDRCLIFAKGRKSIAIVGQGTVDGNGYPKNFSAKTGRPMLLRMMDCSHIRLENITLINPAAWTSAFLYCKDISVVGIRIRSRANHNGDGLDFDGCSHVRVSNSTFDTSDDSICLQASHPDIPCRNVVITNCTFESKWAGLRIGLLSRGDFESVAVSNCTFSNIDDAGLKIQMNEGGAMKNMTFSNLVMKNVPRPIFMTFAQQRACVDAPEEMYPMDSMHDFMFNGMLIDNRELDKESALFITGLPGHPIANVFLHNIRMTVAGGGTKADAENTDLEEFTLDVLKGWWPEYHLVGTLPAYGLFARHVQGLYLDNIYLSTVGRDERPAIVFDDVPEGHVSGSFGNGKPLDVAFGNKKK